MARDLSQTILSRIDPERVTVPIDVDTLSTTSGASSILLPFRTLNPMDQQKKDVAHQIKVVPKKISRSISFARSKTSIRAFGHAQRINGVSFPC